MVKKIASVLSIDLFHWMNRNWAKLVLVLGMASWLSVLSFPGNKVIIVYCNAGQGDETLIQRGFTQILIDGSRPGRALDCLQKHIPFFDRQIELMVVSHPQTDHFGGLADVIKKYRVISFVYNGVRGEAQEWGEFSKLVLAEGAKIETVAAGDEIRVGEMKLKVLWPKSTVGKDGFSQVARQYPNKVSTMEPSSLSEHPFKQFVSYLQLLLTGVQFPRKTSLPPVSGSSVLGVSSPGELNSGAVVMDFNYGDFDALFTGDIGEEEENLLRPGLEQSKAGPFDVLKVAHHGSKYSSSLEFLKAVKPALAVIEVGKNSYGHPTAEAIGRLKEVGARVMRTDQDGEVVVETDGKEWQVRSTRK